MSHMNSLLLLIARLWTNQSRVCCTCAIALLTSGAALADEAVSQSAAAKWLQHLTPLPREIAIPAKLTLKRGEIVVIGDTNASPVIEQAVLELMNMLGRTPAFPENAKFKITFQLGGSEAEALKALKNSAQAYRILPEKEGHGMRLVALSDRGLYYAGKTLQQLLRAHLTAQSVEMPLATVKDWPEMETRGLWGADSFNWLLWMSERKLNYQENISWLTVDPVTKRGQANVKRGTEQLLTLAPRVGIEHAPVVLHLEQLSSKGIFEAYPELRAKGGSPGIICFSQPTFVNVLADWITELGSLPNVERVTVWPTENMSKKTSCQCERCRKENRCVLETRVVLAAWREAQKRKPGLGLRMATSEATYQDNAEIFAEIPREVGIWYYHSLLTYTARQAPMIAGPVAKAAQARRWVGVCPSLVPHVGWAEPFTSPQFAHARASEFTSKGLSGMLGYPTPRILIARFNTEAVAEWLWNPTGRTPREFALSWAVRQRIRDPEKFAEWTELMGPVEWAIYGSEWPAGEKRKSQESVATLLAKAKLPELGTFKFGVFGSPWGDIKSSAQLESNARTAERGLKLAREIRVNEFIQESLVIQGYADSLKALWELKQLVTKHGIAPDKRATARELFAGYEHSLAQARIALRAWESAVPSNERRSGFTRKAIETLQRMSKEMKQSAAKLGVK